MPRAGSDGRANPSTALDGALIDIALGTPSPSVLVRQSKPPLSQVLTGKPVADALALIPLLLPVCGAAQHFAGTRAVEAALGRSASPETEQNRALNMLIERATAEAWRFTVDWPQLVGEKPQLAELKTVRDAATAAKSTIGASGTALKPALTDLADALGGLLPELGSGGGGAPKNAFERLMAGDSLPARVLRLVNRYDAEAGDDSHAETQDVLLATGPLLHDQALSALAADPFDSVAPRLPQPIDVGPIAYCVDKQVSEAVKRYGYCSTTRLFAMVVAAAATMHALRNWSEKAAETKDLDAISKIAGGASVGQAMTARGPVFHAVHLDGDVVKDWRILAPTDWHFAPNGAAAAALMPAVRSGIDRVHASIIIASYDPCARVRLSIDGNDGHARDVHLPEHA